MALKTQVTFMSFLGNLQRTPSKHLAKNGGHIFEWNILTTAPMNRIKRDMLEEMYISKFEPSLNEQLEFKRRLRLFPNGIT